MSATLGSEMTRTSISFVEDFATAIEPCVATYTDPSCSKLPIASTLFCCLIVGVPDIAVSICPQFSYLDREAGFGRDQDGAEFES